MKLFAISLNKSLVVLSLSSALLLLLLQPQSAEARTVATQINSANALELIKKGPDAIGGIGDWHLSNGIICAVISGLGHEHEFSTNGGSLVDLGYCDRADDHLTFTQDLLDGNRYTSFEAEEISIENDGNSDYIIVISSSNGINSRTKYWIDPARPEQLNISKRFTAIAEPSPEFNFISLGQFNYHSLEPFLFSSNNIENSRGFNNIDFVSRGSSAIREAALNADTIITLSPPNATNPIAYGWQLKSTVKITEDSQSIDVPSFVLADEEAMTFITLADDFWIGDGEKIGWFQLPQIPFLSLEKSETLETEETILLGREASIAAITDQLFSNQASVSGRLSEVNSALHIIQENGSPLTHLRPQPDGSFSFKAPAGKYYIKHLGTADRLKEHEITVTDSELNLGTLELPPAATLILPRGQAMRLVFVSLDGTPNPSFDNRLTLFNVQEDDSEFRADRLSQIFLAGIDNDKATVQLAQGKYRVYATRGLEYSIESSEVEIKDGETTTLEITTPTREVSTPGRIAADLHVHAGDSFDNTFSNTERVRTFVAEHGEIMVNSEHDVAVDFNPIIRDMGVQNKVATVTGVEMTSLFISEKMPFTGGHVNFFPYTLSPLEYRKGMINHENRRMRDILQDFRRRGEVKIAQLNHPRQNLSLSSGVPSDFEELIDNGAFLDHMGIAAHPYNPEQAIDSTHNRSLIEADPKTGIRDIDFDAIEIINPGGPYHDDRIIAVRKDWMSFLLQGIKMSGTANSDSHHGSQQVAVPRNMVAVENDDVQTFDQQQFLASIKSGNLYGTTGPMIDVNFEGVEMGGTFKGGSGTLNFSINSASWIPITEADIQINGQSIRTIKLTEQREWSIPLEFDQDSFITLEIHGQASPEYKAIYSGMRPYAFTNPIYIDFNHDGQWTAPGLHPNTE